jgi:nucleotide-binding universal stress UspA family protein
MAFRDLLAIVSSAKEHAPLAAAKVLRKRWSFHLTTLLLAEIPHLASEAITGPLRAEIESKARERLAMQSARINTRLEKFDPPAELRTGEVFAGTEGDAAAHAAMHADLVLLERSDETFAQAVLEGVLFNSGRPLLLLPSRWRGEAIGNRIVVAWNATREAARSLADAAPFFEDADEAKVVTVGASEPLGSQSGPGVEIAGHLARRGMDIELRQVDRRGRTTAEALLAEARDIGADLIIMGGYGHSRLREMMFGGVTRALIDNPSIPLFMAH